MKYIYNFVQSAVNGRKEGNGNPNSNVVTETMKLLANISYGYQNLDQNRQRVEKFLSDERSHGAINKN